jgi:LysM repeat protein
VPTRRGVLAPIALVAALALGGSAGTYVVRPGDTLSSIAAHFGVSVKALADANHITNSDRVYAGRSLKVPGGVVVAEAAAPARHAVAEQEVDRLVDAATASDDHHRGVRLALDLLEPGGAEQCDDLVGFAESEHAWSAGQPAERGQLDVSAHHIADQRQPLVGLETLPTDERGTTAGPQRASDVGEGLHRVVEEHKPELADEEVERAGREGVRLCVRDHELHVVNRSCPRPATGQLHQRLRQVDADDSLGLCRDRERRRARSAANVEHDPLRVTPRSFQQPLGERFQLALVTVGVVDEVQGLRAVPRLRLSFVRWHEAPCRR